MCYGICKYEKYDGECGLTPQVMMELCPFPYDYDDDDDDDDDDDNETEGE